jgi:hypothetical protein
LSYIFRNFMCISCTHEKGIKDKKNYGLRHVNINTKKTITGRSLKVSSKSKCFFFFFLIIPFGYQTSLIMLNRIINFLFNIWTPTCSKQYSLTDQNKPKTTYYSEPIRRFLHSSPNSTVDDNNNNNNKIII